MADSKGAKAKNWIQMNSKCIKRTMIPAQISLSLSLSVRISRKQQKKRTTISQFQYTQKWYGTGYTRKHTRKQNKEKRNIEHIALSRPISVMTKYFTIRRIMTITKCIGKCSTNRKKTETETDKNAMQSDLLNWTEYGLERASLFSTYFHFCYGFGQKSAHKKQIHHCILWMTSVF